MWGPTQFLKVTYHEYLTFSVFKCYNWVLGLYTNPGNVKKKQPSNFFLSL